MKGHMQQPPKERQLVPRGIRGTVHDVLSTLSRGRVVGRGRTTHITKVFREKGPVARFFSRVLVHRNTNRVLSVSSFRNLNSVEQKLVIDTAREYSGKRQPVARSDSRLQGPNGERMAVITDVLNRAMMGHDLRAIEVWLTKDPARANLFFLR